MREESKEELAWALAGTQEWLITLAQLRELGFSKPSARRRVGNRRLWGVYPGVYAVGHPGMTARRERMAAVLACGTGAGLAQLSAAVHWEVWEGPEPIKHHVAVANRSGRSGAVPVNELAARIQIHRPRVLRPGIELVEYRGIPVTSLERTAIDVAAVLTPWRLRGFLRQLERKHRFDLHSLAAQVAQAPPHSWRPARLRRALGYVLDDSGTTQTEREALFLDICRRYGIPQMRPQRAIGSKRVDFIDDELMLIVEIDDRESHEGHVAFMEDRKRDRDNANRGYETIRFTVSECRHEPALVASDTLKARERRRKLLAA